MFSLQKDIFRSSKSTLSRQCFVRNILPFSRSIISAKTPHNLLNTFYLSEYGGLKCSCVLFLCIENKSRLYVTRDKYQWIQIVIWLCYMTNKSRLQHFCHIASISYSFSHTNTKYLCRFFAVPYLTAIKCNNPILCGLRRLLFASRLHPAPVASSKCQVVTFYSF